MNRIRLLGLMATITIGIVACSAPTSPGPSGALESSAAPGGLEQSEGSSLPHPCTLLTAQDAEEVLGAGAHIKRDSDSACVIEGANPADGVLAVNVEPLSATWDSGKKLILDMRKDSATVPGIGDDAYTFMGGIIFRKGNASVNVIATAYNGRKPKEEVVMYLAKRIAAAM